MESLPAYERDPYQQQMTVRVVAVGEHEGQPMAVLDDTLIFPEGGGQPSDRGRLGSVEVVDAVHHPDGVRHLLAAPVAVGLETTLEVDWARRFDHMQQHTAQHLLTAVAADRFGWPTTSFHLGADVCDIEIEAPDLGRHQLDALEEAVAAEIRAAHEVRDRRVPKDAFERLEVRTRGLPAGHFVVLCGYDKGRRTVHVADPLHTNPLGLGTQFLTLDADGDWRSGAFRRLS